MLDETRVLDLSHLLPGQFATALLAQLGAEVITVEPTGGGDYLRKYGASYAAYNHSKRSLSLDLKEAEGRDAFLSVAADADVIVEEFRPGVVDRLGVDYDSVNEVNPEIVYCSISGHGQDGPRADQVGHDLNYIGVSGMLDIAPKRDGVPLYPPVPVADMSTAIFGALSVAAALNGEGGEYIDLSMTEAGVNTMSVHLAEYAGRDEQFGWGDTGMLGGYPCYNVYECSDGGYVTLAAIEPHFWEALCDALNLPEFADDQWANDQSRRNELFDTLRQRFKKRTRDEWIEFFDLTDVPVGPVNRLPEVQGDEEFTYRGTIQEVKAGDRMYPMTRFPALFTNHTVEVDAPPSLGEDTREILNDIGFSEEDIERLARDEVVEF